ncbi:MAG TPA: tetratricopeptide repeat protein [Bradyrhizobium sp.]|uniref:tetratricopeptide repeat protein n=1 Tax=Bradyrhizobium sp. TaxID=376 RepID=UPI002BED504A|nr:tetratricopeptide repeat protein [Bradyrhizobium sp.]HLZ03043.1 tetratricopeptide repeat protein [Bradyrhizobium sp.]
MNARKSTAALPELATGAWAPRLAQEQRLKELDARLAQPAGDTINTEIERAVLLAALNRHQEAQQAFVGILRRAPTHFGALNEFGNLLTRMGAIEAACRVYAEAILHHPDNPLARVNLANLLLRATRYAEAREHYELALKADPDHAEAHQGLGAALADLGDRAGAREHFKRGFRGHAVSTLPYRGDTPPIRLLQLVSSGGGNIPSGLFLDDTRFLTTVVVADYFDSATPLPSYQLIFNAIGDADLCEPALEAASRIVAGATVPVINDPRAVIKTGRIGNSERLRGIAGVQTARTVAIARHVLAGAEGARALAEQGFSYPLLLRSPGYHTGRNFIQVETAADLPAAAQSLPGEELLAIEYLDARGRDGKARKFRVMMISGRLYPLHLAISQSWKVHYFTSDMADQPDHRVEEMKFLEDMPGTLGARAMRALKTIQATLGLDYAGIDFGLAPDGGLLLFEANATMVIAKPGHDAHWAYRHRAIDRVLEAVVAMLMDKAA